MFIASYKYSTPFDGTLSHLEYFYWNREFDKTAVIGARLFEELPLKYSHRKDLLELLVRSNVHLNEKEAALKYLALLLDEFRSEDPGRDFLKIQTHNSFGMRKEVIESCKDYLNTRPGDLYVIRLLIENSKAMGIDCETGWLWKIKL